MSITMLLAAMSISSPPPEELNIKTLDISKPNAQQQQQQSYEDVIGLPRAYQRNIVIPLQSTYLGTLTVSLPKKIPLEELDLSLRPRKPSSDFFLYPQALSVEYLEKKKNVVRVTYAIESRGKPQRRRYTLKFSVSIFKAASTKPARVKNFKHVIKIVPPETQARPPRFIAQTHNYFQNLASKAINELPAGTNAPSIRSLPSSLYNQKLPKAWSRLFFSHRLKASIAERELYKSLKSATKQERDEILTAIFNLRYFEDSVQSRLAPYTTTPQSSLKAAVKKLLRYELSDALYLAKFARNSGKLDITLLAKSLLIIGGIQLLGATDSQSAIDTVNKAFCLKMDLDFPLASTRLAQALAKIKSSNLCKQKLNIQQVKARRFIEDGNNMVEVTGLFDPDPYKMVSGGTIELWGAGGDIIESAQIRAEREPINRVVSTFEDRGDIQNYVGDILIRIIVKDVAGTELAYYGRTDPIALSIDESSISIVDRWGPWLWVLTGIAITSAGLFAYSHFSSQEAERGIGPVTIRF
ncbi:MAG: hypothetical protein VYC39_12075 [Myxococcota bacterium]|nr:hypothetical protein [Myxococcota bacterium]